METDTRTPLAEPFEPWITGDDVQLLKDWTGATDAQISAPLGVTPACISKWRKMGTKAIVKRPASYLIYHMLMRPRIVDDRLRNAYGKVFD